MIVTSGIPAYKLIPGVKLTRIFRTYFDGKRAPAWFFSSTSSPRAGRFDLVEPDGTCYFSDEVAGCWLEVFRSTRVVQQTDVDARSVAVIRRVKTTLNVANLTDPHAVVAGVTLDQSAGADYRDTQVLASQLHVEGHGGVIGWIRRDPAARFSNFALFGPGGAHHEVPRWQTSQEPLANRVPDVAARLPVHLAGIPHDMPIAKPPTRRRASKLNRD